ncbi:MAG: tRNA 2-selenouridine(34) synthase MnmH, partial [Azoarcus sp.]|nr:tRNA 2-selenouridine(34) synthase MnmH [Azoarcus sp.]
EAAIEDRVAFLCEDYAALFDSPEEFKRLLACLVGQHGHQLVGRWHGLIDAGARAELFRELIERHYDPAYRRSSHGLFRGLPRARPFVFRPNADELAAEAQRLLEELGEEEQE